MKLLILEIIITNLFANFHLSISFKNLIFTYSGISKLGFVNEKIIVECPVKAQFYLWKLYQMHTEPQVLLQQEGKFLTIDPVTADKSGIYECKSTTGFSNTDTNITVKIIDPQSEIVTELCSMSMSPKIRDVNKGICFFNERSSKVLRYKVGDNIEMDCTAAGTDLKYFWSFIDSNRMKRSLNREMNISKVIIKSVIPENEGSYKCDITNEYGNKLSRTFKVTLSDLPPDLKIIGEKQDDVAAYIGQKIFFKCEVKSNYNRIHSIKWGKRIRHPISDSNTKLNLVSWDQYTYSLLSESDINKIILNPNHMESSINISIIDPDQSGIYTCLAMDATGRTAHKVFNITVTTEYQVAESNSKSYFFLLYILLPVILLFLFVCAIIYCCVKSSSKKSNNSLPLKKIATPTTNNVYKDPANYYYPVSNNRPPLPQPNESQASLVSPNTMTSYSSYGNYHMQSTNQPSCCSSNGVSL
uniref:Nou-darake like-2 protein n=1 Tax=Dugesia japonica TaxID=6161 RepID=A0A068Q6P3_DUGJA|nr:nou-darake like-2 protein [Dugesia japonica]